ncbi:MAG: polysaccharide deacetylase family protein [Bacteroidetes bacterium]|nr:polysaccharide deacetylase family protein [Bacteroidota bacterium]
MKQLLRLFSSFFFPGLTWKMPSGTKSIFLTFDDGPHPEITPKVLNILEAYDAKATFFCVGENAVKYTDTYREILKHGHRTGNHTFHHLKGWNTPSKTYLHDTLECSKQVKSVLFRPPYGKITPLQIKALKKEGFSIIMWSVLTRDYKRSADPKKLLRNAIKRTQPGSIIVFHDSKKADHNLMYILPRFLEHFSKKGYLFKVI